MTVFEQVCLKPGHYPWMGEKVAIPASELAEYAENTQELLDTGFQIPIYDRHGMPGAEETGPRLSNKHGHGNSALDSLGFVKSCSVNKDGELQYSLKIKDPEAARKITNGSIRFTSPELRPNFYHPESKITGRCIAHVALTNNPRTQNQGKIVDAHKGAMQFSLDDYQGPIQMAIHPDEQGDKNTDHKDEDSSTSSHDTDKEPNEGTGNLDMIDGPKNDDSISELVTLLEKAAHVSLDTTLDLNDSKVLISHLTTALKTKIASDQAAEVVAPVPEQSPVKEEPLTMGTAQFSADSPEGIELTALRQEKVDRVASDVAGTREGLGVRMDKMPKGIKEHFGGDKNVLQFSADGVEEPSFTLTHILDGLEKYIPKIMQFGGDDAKEESHPEGGKFATGDAEMTDEEADAIVADGNSGWTHDNKMQVSNPTTDRVVAQ